LSVLKFIRKGSKRGKWNSGTQEKKDRKYSNTQFIPRSLEKDPMLSSMATLQSRQS